jgi:hypothetical protein
MDEGQPVDAVLNKSMLYVLPRDADASIAAVLSPYSE